MDISQETKEKLASLATPNEIERGSIYRFKNKDMVKSILTKEGGKPYFLTKEFSNRREEKGKTPVVNHPWIFLRTYKKKRGIGKVYITVRSHLKDDERNREPNDFRQQQHSLIQTDHKCSIGKDGLYKGNLKYQQKMNKVLLKELTMGSENFICLDPQIDLIAKHFTEINEVYD